MTNVNPGNRDPRDGVSGSSRVPSSRDAYPEYSDRYEAAGDGSFDDAYEEYYDAPVDSSGGRHRLDDADDDAISSSIPAVGEPAGYDSAYEDVEGYEDYNDYNRDGYEDSTEYADYADYADNSDYAAPAAAYTEAADYGEYRDSGDYADYGEGDSYDRYDDYEDYDGYDDHDGYEDHPDRAERRTAVAPATAGRSSSAVAAGGVPKRGLAMILIAVAVLLGLWGIYAMMQKNDSGDQTAEQNQNQQDQNSGAGAQNQNGQNGTNGQVEQGGANGQNQQDPNTDQNRDSDAGRAGGGQPMTADNETINVYNNSTVGNLAADVSDTLRGQGTNVGEVGNLPGDVATYNETTVFFDPATPGAEERARVLADRVGGVAREIDNTIPRDAVSPDALTLVLTGPVAL